jgi:hypothetical protein
VTSYTDAQGYPGTIQANGTYDGGDTAAIIGTIDTLAPSGKYAAPWDYTNGVPLRHPDVTKWYGQPDRFSRDQLIPMICSSMTNSLRGYRFYGAHKKRFLLTAWNIKGNGSVDMPNKFPDLCGPEIWGLWVRFHKPWWARLVLGILDLQTLVGAIQWRWFTPISNRVTRNHMLVCITQRRNLPTLVSELAYHINNYPDLIERWRGHCEAVGEYPTADLFQSLVETLSR